MREFDVLYLAPAGEGFLVGWVGMEGLIFRG